MKKTDRKRYMKFIPKEKTTQSTNFRFKVLTHRVLGRLLFESYAMHTNMMHTFL